MDEEKEEKVTCKLCRTTFSTDDDLTHMNDCPEMVWTVALKLLYDSKHFYFQEEEIVGE